MSDITKAVPINIDAPFGSRERFNALTAVDRKVYDRFDELWNAKTDAQRTLTLAWYKVPADQKLHVRYFVREDLKCDGAEVQFGDFGILDTAGRGLADALTRDISEFVFLTLPPDLGLMGLPMNGWDREVNDCFRRNTADPMLQLARTPERDVNGEWINKKVISMKQPGLTDRAYKKYSRVIVRTNAATIRKVGKHQLFSS